VSGSESRWLGVWCPPSVVQKVARRVVSLPTPMIVSWRWVPSAIFIGILPLAVGYWLGSSIVAQVVTGLTLALLFVATLPSDRFWLACGIVSLSISSHSALVIALTVHDPLGASLCLRGSEEYWLRTWHWVQTGEDVEYQWRTWVPAHILLLTMLICTGAASMGAIPFARGIEELDYMNFYVGQLISHSERAELAIVFGWHPWSFVRGLSYTIVLFEVSSWSLQGLTGERFSTPQRRRLRWGIGLSLAFLDATIKATFSPWIRDQLFSNLATTT
jgi:hypothetical protein